MLAVPGSQTEDFFAMNSAINYSSEPTHERPNRHKVEWLKDQFMIERYKKSCFMYVRSTSQQLWLPDTTDKIIFVDIPECKEVSLRYYFKTREFVVTKKLKGSCI